MCRLPSPAARSPAGSLSSTASLVAWAAEIAPTDLASALAAADVTTPSVCADVALGLVLDPATASAASAAAMGPAEFVPVAAAEPRALAGRLGWEEGCCRRLKAAWKAGCSRFSGASLSASVPATRQISCKSISGIRKGCLSSYVRLAGMRNTGLLRPKYTNLQHTREGKKLHIRKARHEHQLIGRCLRRATHLAP